MFVPKQLLPKHLATETGGLVNIQFLRESIPVKVYGVPQMLGFEPLALFLKNHLAEKSHSSKSSGHTRPEVTLRL